MRRLGPWGWILLVAALSLPTLALLHFRRSMPSAQKAVESPLSPNAKQGARPFAFASAPGGPRPVNPLGVSSKTAATAGYPAASANPGAAGASGVSAIAASPAPMQGAAPPASGGASPAAALAAARPPANPQPFPPPVAPPAGGAVFNAAAPAMSTSSLAAFPLRDPTLSPEEIAFINRPPPPKIVPPKPESKSKSKPKPKRKKRKKPRRNILKELQRSLEVEGIITGRSGAKAIINGTPAGVGDLVGDIAGPYKAKVEGITNAGVVFSYKKVQFVKKVNTKLGGD